MDEFRCGFGVCTVRAVWILTWWLYHSLAGWLGARQFSAPSLSFSSVKWGWFLLHQDFVKIKSSDSLVEALNSMTGTK